jgi:TonB family protein
VLALVGLLLLPSIGAAQSRGQRAQLVAPQAIFTPEAPYPEGGTGDTTVLLELNVAEDGSVASSSVQRGEEPFGEAARQGVKRWHYRPATRNGVPVRVGISVTLRFAEPPQLIPALPPEKSENATSADEVDDAPVAEVVVRSEPRPEIGGTFIPQEEARQIPGTFADPFRVAEVLPGTAPILSGLPYFFVRGAPPGNVAYLIDGIRVPLLFHVGAGPSVISSSMVERVDVVPSAYPARFGRSAGGIIAGETTPLSNVARGQIQARAFDASGLLEVPFANERASVLVAGRYSYVQPLLDKVSPDYELGYWDYQARAGYQLNENNAISLFAFGAYDHLASRERQLTLFDTQFHRLDLRWDRYTADGNTQVGITAGTDRVANADEDAAVYTSEIEDRSLRLRWSTDQKVARGITLRTGLDYGLNRVSKEQDTGPTEVEQFPERYDLSGSAYIDTILKAPGVEVVPGFRMDAALWRNQGYAFPQPRLATRLRLFSGLSWTSQFGVSHQLPTQSVRIPGRAADPLESALQTAWQAAEGLELLFSRNMLAKVTGFYSLVDSDANDLTSKSYGLEFFLRREFIESVGGILSYTLSRTEASFGRDTVRSEFDRTHVVSAVLGWNMGAGFQFGLRGYFASGRRFEVYCPTPDCVPGGTSDAPREYWLRGRLPNFYRADLRFEKRWEIGYTSWLAVTLEWFNATLTKETTAVSWSPELGRLVYLERDALTLPSLGIEAGF